MVFMYNKSNLIDLLVEMVNENLLNSIFNILFAENVENLAFCVVGPGIN